MQEAIICERSKGRKKILQNPQEFLQRIADAKRKLNLMIKDENMRKNYFDGLKQLEKEFLNELTFDRNI